MPCSACKILGGHVHIFAMWTDSLCSTAVSSQSFLSAPTVPGVLHWGLLPHLLLGGGLSMLQPLLP